MSQEHKKLERLLLFSEVAQLLSFTAAADKLAISRGHLSAQIRRLEKEMGMPLLVRSTRSVKLTAEGARVLAGMSKIRNTLLEIDRDVAHEGNAIAGMLKITAPLQFTERYLFDIINRFKQHYPQIEFMVDCSYVRHDLLQSDFDLAFRATNEPPQNMVARALLSYKQMCCASPAYLAKHGTPATPADLIHHQCLRNKDQPSWQFKHETVSIDGWLKINDNTLLKRQALLGGGIIQLPEYMVEQDIKAGRLVPFLQDYIIHSRCIYMMHPQMIQQSKKLAAFSRYTRDYFTALDKSP